MSVLRAHLAQRMCVVSIGTRNQWNKFNNDYQIDDLSRTHARRTSAINRRHRWTPYRTLMHSVISRRFMVLPPVCSVIHELFSRAYLRAIIIRRVRVTRITIQKVSGSWSHNTRFFRYDLWSYRERIAPGK